MQATRAKCKQFNSVLSFNNYLEILTMVQVIRVYVVHFSLSRRIWILIYLMKFAAQGASYGDNPDRPYSFKMLKLHKILERLMWQQGRRK
jgi:hypothetical protein